MAYKPIGQSVCRVCGETAGVGTAVVVAYGDRGRAHKECLQNAQNPVLSKRKRPD